VLFFEENELNEGDNSNRLVEKEKPDELFGQAQ